jgi:hypothetical protein
MSVRRFFAALALVGSLLASAVPAFAAGASVTHMPVIWANGDLFGTVAVAGDLPAPTEANSHSYDAIYTFPGLATQRSIAEAGPGDPGFNGGRWMVYQVSFTGGAPSQELTSLDELQPYIDSGQAQVSGPVRYFVCTLIKAKG